LSTTPVELTAASWATINWKNVRRKSRQQSIVALSTTEAEYIAAAEACKELIWINRLFQDLAIPTLLNEISLPIL